MMEAIKPTLPIEAINYMSTVYKLMAFEMVLDDLQEIITQELQKKCAAILGDIYNMLVL